MRHDALTKYVLNAIIKKNFPKSKFIDKRESEYIMKINGFEFWWNLSIKTATNVPNTKPDLIVWEKLNKAYKVIMFSRSADTNITGKVQNKIKTPLGC